MQIDLPVWVIVLAVIGGVLGAIGGIIYLARVAILLAKILEGINALLPIVPNIVSMTNQFKTDGGSSLRDEMNKNTEQGRRSEMGDVVRDQKIDDLRAEQTRLALQEMRQPATTHNISITGDTHTETRRSGGVDVKDSTVSAGQDIGGGDKVIKGKITDGEITAVLHEGPKEG